MSDRRQMYQLAVPTIIENIFQITLSTVDTWFVAGLGAVAISAVGLNTLISNLYLTFFIALGTGISIMTARSHGEMKPFKTNERIQEGLLITLGISALILLINILLGHIFLGFLAKDPELKATAYVYFRVVILPIAGLAAMTVLSSILKSLKDTRTPMYTVLIINLINVVLDWILIRGVGNFQGLGLLGAGIATTSARFIGMIILLLRLQSLTGFMSGFRFVVTESLREMIGYALPVGMEKLSMRIGQLVYGSLIVAIGIEHYAGHNIAGTIEAYSYLPAMGFGVASFTMIGHAIGEGHYEALRPIGFMTYRAATAMMIGIGVIFFVFAPQLTGLFTDDPTITYLVVTVLRLIALFQPMLACTQVLSSSLQALGDVKYPLFLTTIGIWCIRIVGTYVLGNRLGMGLVGVWIAYVIDISFRGIMLIIRFYKKTASMDAMKEAYDPMHNHVHTQEKAVKARLAKIVGHTKSIEKMYEEGRDCTEILNQIAAVRSALNSVGKVILKDHVNHCIIDAVNNGDERAIADLNKSIDKLL